LFNAIIDKIFNKAKEENRRPDMKILISAEDVLIWGKDKKEIEEKLNQWNLIIKECGLRMNMDKTATMIISRNLDTNVRIKVNDTTVKEVDKFIHVGSEINSEGMETDYKNSK
jgi:hypothetical protein